MEQKGKIYGIDIIRIFSCASVYSMHYCAMELEESKEAIAAFRSSVWARSIFGIFWTGPATVAFFVMAGFFITYGLSPDRSSSKELARKCTYKSLNILIPTCLVILFTALVTLILSPFGMSSMFSLSDIGKDIFKLVIGIPGDKRIHYGYPLWFQHFIFTGYLLGYAFLRLFSDKGRVKYAAYAAVLAYALFNAEYVYMVFAGMLAGELCSGECGSKIRAKFTNNGLNCLLILADLSVMAALFRMDYDRPEIYGPAVFFIGLLLVFTYCVGANRKDHGEERFGRLKSCISRLSADTYSCYLIHFFIFCSVMRMIHTISLKAPLLWANNTAGCVIMYIVMTLVLWPISDLFAHFVLKPLRRLYDIIWNKLEGICFDSKGKTC